MFTNLDHNFWTRNPSRLSKVSKDSDCSLESNKNFSEILPSNSWHPGPGNVGQGGLKVLRLWHHSQPTRTPQAKKSFSSANYKTCHVFRRFGQVHNPCRSEDIPVQSHVWISCFLQTAWTNPHVKVLTQLSLSKASSACGIVANNAENQYYPNIFPCLLVTFLYTISTFFKCQ